MIMCSGTYGQQQPREAQKTKKECGIRWIKTWKHSVFIQKVSRRRFCLGDPHFSKLLLLGNLMVVTPCPSAPPRGGGTVFIQCPLYHSSEGNELKYCCWHYHRSRYTLTMQNTSPHSCCFSPETILSTVHHALFYPSKTYAHITEINQREK